MMIARYKRIVNLCRAANGCASHCIKRSAKIKKATFPFNRQHVFPKYDEENDGGRCWNRKSNDEDDRVLLHQKNSNFHVLIGQEPTCDSQKQQVAGRKTCIHIIWCLVNSFGLNKTDALLAQIEFGGVLRELLKKRRPEIPEYLKNFKSTTRKFLPKLLQHPKFSVKEHWFISRKTSGAPPRCFGAWSENR